MGYLGENVKKLGFGLMRLPHLANGETDLEQVNAMVDKFLAAGCTYFDTAFVYDGGKSEEAFRECVVKRYPRESFTLATKLMAAFGVANAEEAKNEINISLQRTGAGYVDFYLLHGIGDDSYKAKYEAFGLFDYVKELKEKGLIRHMGFSFHGSPECLDTVLTEHPDLEFVQLQLNYVDWEDKGVRARRCYETARRHNVPVVIMEPVKGGSLANPHENVANILKEANPDVSLASWAIRFAASLPGVITVLSGMSNIEQMEDNLSYMTDFRPLSDDEQAVILKAREAFNAIPQIKCTACSYCTAGCPTEINIPGIFAARNVQSVWNNADTAKKRYEHATANGGKASDCIACGQCEGACPQGLPIVDLLKECAVNFEG